MTRAERFHRARRDPRLAVLEGFHAVKHALRFGAHVVEIVLAESSQALELSKQLAPDVGITLSEAKVLGQAEFATLSPQPHPTGAMAIAHRRFSTVAEVLQAPPVAPLVLLEAPAHLGNLGAAVRVAAAAGARGLLATGPHDPWQPEAVRAAAGLQYALPVAHTATVPSGCRPLIAIDAGGDSIATARVPDNAILAFGTERAGLSDQLRRQAERTLSIPMTAGVSSLNLATAVAVVLYAWKLEQPGS